MSKKKIQDFATRAVSIFGGAAGRKMDAAGLGRQVTSHAYPGGPSWPVERIHAQLRGGSYSGCTVHVHGLMGDDLTWRKGDEDDLGGHLQREAGELPVYLRYNSGLDLHSSARRLDEWLRSLEHALSPDLPLSLICHSMGGLVCLLAINRTHAQWTRSLHRLVLLGVPQHGAPLARAASRTESLLEELGTGWSKTIAVLFQLRGDSIADLAEGVRDTPVVVPSHTRVFVAAGLLGDAPEPDAAEPEVGVVRKLLGDALVDLDSASGSIDHAHLEIFERTGHQQLMYSREVWNAVTEWWDGGPSPFERTT